MNRSEIAVFLDRDGTVNTEVHFLSSPEQLQLIPRTVSAIRDLNALGVRVFVITNQSGVARGIFPESAVTIVHDALRAMLREEGAELDDFFYCPHLPGASVPRYNRECNCRKPKPGMLHQARERFGIDLQRSFVIGDRCIDVEAGKAVGAGTVMVSTGYGMRNINECTSSPDYFAVDLYDGVQFVKEKILSLERSSTSTASV